LTVFKVHFCVSLSQVLVKFLLIFLTFCAKLVVLSILFFIIFLERASAEFGAKVEPSVQVLSTLFAVCVCSGQTPAEADFNLLDTARKVDVYGLHLFPALVCYFWLILSVISGLCFCVYASCWL